VELEIVPEPSEAERAAIVEALELERQERERAEPAAVDVCDS
jgi:hypothetical protein